MYRFKANSNQIEPTFKLSTCKISNVSLIKSFSRECSDSPLTWVFSPHLSNSILGRYLIVVYKYFFSPHLVMRLDPALVESLRNQYPMDQPFECKNKGLLVGDQLELGQT